MPVGSVADAPIQTQIARHFRLVRYDPRPVTEFPGGTIMIRRLLLTALCAIGLWAALPADSAQAEQAYGRQWGRYYNTQDWDRFYHYPYVYYPQNFWGDEYYRSAESLYYRYPQEMRIPVYNKQWFNYYPKKRVFHRGHHFNLDVF
jgi:hypothetical protein